MSPPPPLFSPFLTELQLRMRKDFPPRAGGDDSSADLPIRCSFREEEGNPSLSAHSLVLLAASPLLREAAAAAGEAGDLVLILPDFSPRSVRTALSLFYSGECPWRNGDDEVLELLEVLGVDVGGLSSVRFVPHDLISD